MAPSTNRSNFLVLQYLLFFALFAARILSAKLDQKNGTENNSSTDALNSIHKASSKSRTLYDYQTRIVAYKDLIESRCLLEFLKSGESFISQSTQRTRLEDISEDFFMSENQLTKRQIWTIGGQRITEFCRGFPTYLIQNLNLTESENNLDLNEVNRRTKRQTKHYFVGKIRGQTQSQYLNFGGSNDAGKAEAESTHEGSRAVVTGSSGMGQAQSQSSPFGCEECYGGGAGQSPDQQQVLQYGRPGQGGSSLDQGRLTQHPGGTGEGSEHSYPVGPDGRTDGQGGTGTTYPGGSGGGYYPGQVAPGNIQQGGSGGRTPGTGQNGGYPGQQGARYPESGYPGGTGGSSYPGAQTGEGSLPGHREPGFPGQQPTGHGAVAYPGGPGGFPGQETGGNVRYPGQHGQGGGYPSGNGQISGGDGREQGSGGGYPGQHGGRGTEQNQETGAGYPGGGTHGQNTGSTGYPGQQSGRGGAGYPGQQNGRGTGGEQSSGEGYPGGRGYPGQQSGREQGSRGGGYPGQQGITGTGGQQGSGDIAYPGQDGRSRPQGGYPSQTGSTGQGGAGYPAYYPEQTSSQGPAVDGRYPIPPGRQTAGKFSGQLSGNYDSQEGNRGKFSGVFSGQYENHRGYIEGAGGSGWSGSPQPGGVRPNQWNNAQGGSVGYPGSGGYPSSQQGTPDNYITGQPGGQSIHPGSGGQNIGRPGIHPETGGQRIEGQGGYPGSGSGTSGGGDGTRYPIGPGQGYPGSSSIGPGKYPGGGGHPGAGLPGSGTGFPGSNQGYPGTGTGGAGSGYPGIGQGGYPGSGPQTGGYPSGGGQNGRYPGAGDQSGQFPDGRTQTGAYPGSGSSSGQFPSGESQTGGYPGATSQTGGYPGAASQTGGYPGAASQTGGYPGASSQTGGYPGASSQTGGYPGASSQTGGYPGALTQPGGYPGAGSQTGQYPGGGGRLPGGGTQPGGQTGAYPGSGGGSYPGLQTGRGPGQNKYPDSVQTIGHPGQYPSTSQTGGNYYDQSGQITSPDENDDDAHSQVQTAVQESGNKTQASASAQGKYQGGQSQSQVSGTYSGSGSFSASAGSDDGKRGATSQVSGGKEGAQSSAQGRGGLGQSQAQVQLSSDSGDTISSSQTSGLNHGSQTQVQASGKGGMADAQANGPGSTSSQAQIGFSPYDEDEKDEQQTPFSGGGTASAQSGTHAGQAQSQIQGKFHKGIRYTGAAQAGSGSKDFISAARNQSGLSFPTIKPFNLPAPTKKAQKTETEASEPYQEETAAPEESDDYDENDEDYDDTTTPKPETKSIITQEHPNRHQRQHIILDPLESLDATVQQSYGDRPKDGTVLQPGQFIPGFNGYQIPSGFRGRVKSISGGNTYASGKHSQAQTVNLTPGTGRIIYKPPIYGVASKTQSRNGQMSYGSGYSYQPQYQLKSGQSLPNFVSVTKSESGSRNPYTGQKIPSVYYTQSSSCGVFTNTCVFNGGTKLCQPIPKTNPDGSPVVC